MCSVKFTFFDIVVIFLFTVKQLIFKAGFGPLAGFFYAKPSRPFVWHKETLSVRCQDRGPSINYVDIGQASFICWSPPWTEYCVASVTNKLVESFYDVKYWTSITSSNVRQINFSNENIKNQHWCFQISKIVSQKYYFGILIYILSWKHLFEIYFRLLRRNNKLEINNFLTNIWRYNWRSVFDVVKGLRYNVVSEDDKGGGRESKIADFET